MPVVIPPHSKTVALQLALADYLQQQTGIEWREFSDVLSIAKSGALSYSGLISFTRKGGEGRDEGYTYRVQTRFRCAGKDKRIVDESLGDYIDFLDTLLLRCVRVHGTYRSVVLNQNVRVEPEGDWVINIVENQDEGAKGTIARTWKLELDDYAR